MGSGSPTAVDHLATAAYVLSGLMLFAKAGALAVLWGHRDDNKLHFPSVLLVPLTILGCALGDLFILADMLPVTDATCMARPALLSLAGTLVVTPLIVRVWHARRIFINPMRDESYFDGGYAVAQVLFLSTPVLAVVGVWYGIDRPLDGGGDTCDLGGGDDRCWPCLVLCVLALVIPTYGLRLGVATRHLPKGFEGGRDAVALLCPLLSALLLLPFVLADGAGDDDAASGSGIGSSASCAAADDRADTLAHAVLLLATLVSTSGSFAIVCSETRRRLSALGTEVGSELRITIKAPRVSVPLPLLLNPPAQKDGFHVFLSHAWADGQDQVGQIKVVLRLMVPSVRPPLPSLLPPHPPPSHPQMPSLLLSTLPSSSPPSPRATPLAPPTPPFFSRRPMTRLAHLTPAAAAASRRCGRHSCSSTWTTCRSRRPSSSPSRALTLSLSSSPAATSHRTRPRAPCPPPRRRQSSATRPHRLASASTPLLSPRASSTAFPLPFPPTSSPSPHPLLLLALLLLALLLLALLLLALLLLAPLLLALLLQPPPTPRRQAQLPSRARRGVPQPPEDLRRVDHTGPLALWRGARDAHGSAECSEDVRFRRCGHPSRVFPPLGALSAEQPPRGALFATVATAVAPDRWHHTAAHRTAVAVAPGLARLRFGGGMGGGGGG